MFPLSAQFAYLQRLLAALEIELLRLPLGNAVTYPIPPTKPEDEYKRVVQIKTGFQTRVNAVKQAIISYKDLHIINGLSKKYTRQTPGFISFYAPSLPKYGVTYEPYYKLIDIVNEINSVKNGIRNHITQTYPTRNARFQAMKEHCPASMTLHVYRNIKMFVGEDIKSLGFTWVNQDDLRRTTRAELIEQINKLIETSESTNYIRAMNTLANTISNIPDERLRLRRAISRPQPCVNITYNDKDKPPTMTHVSMPIIVIQNTSPLCGHFKNYNQADRKVRADKLKTSVLTVLNGFNIEIVE